MLHYFLEMDVKIIEIKLHYIVMVNKKGGFAPNGFRWKYYETDDLNVCLNINTLEDANKV